MNERVYFEGTLQNVLNKAREEKKNVNIGIIALNHIYNNLTEEQKESNENIEALLIILKNLIN